MKFCKGFTPVRSAKVNTLGFTLVELLIAITIIAILSIIGLSVYQSVYKSSRDAKRRSDLKFIQSALEQYHGDQKYYPFTLPSNGSELSFTNSSGRKFVYMNKVPQDPGTTPYLYMPSGTGCSSNDTAASCSGYCLYVRLENSTGVTSDPGCSVPPSGYSGYNYGVTRP